MASLLFIVALLLLVATSLAIRQRVVFLGVLLVFDLVAVGLLARFGATLG